MVGPLLASFVTVLTGVVVLAFWAQSERTQQDRRSSILGIAHVGLAAGAVALWTVFAIGRASGIGRVSVGVLFAAVAAGIATVVSSRHGERVQRDIDAVPVAALAVHGLMAAVTLAAVVVAFRSR